ncbi:SusC/RagA family TonB-linked outer membrane protein [Arcticibacter tournemirensis]|uniref:TonB-dependent receptor n=1 Tax=Arcticibacter tournemirensis TaxID=699437 RepID=A0A4Q0M8X1_9SPHI|nr:TonB-dependent receptor [Arcticibacter tournemirensis]RXF69176.1 TonB-dependent receptor [Arcticibacter tournemirensis]
MRKVLLLTLLFALIVANPWTLLLAQNTQKVLKGTVSDDKGGVLPGASVTVKNTKASTMTDAGGQFTLAVPQGGTTLVVSFIGMTTQEVPIGNRTTFKVVLKDASTSLNEVVVVGYGAIRRANVTSSIASVNQKEIRNLPVAGVDQALQGKVAGVSVTSNSGQPGGGVSVRVRGITSVNGNEPLYVIDGVPISAESNSLKQDFLGGSAGQSVQSVMATLSPSDIESIDILKDASAQAIYGSRAANGVVLINTKRGKAGVGKVTYDTYYGLQEVQKKLSVLDLRQNAEYLNSLVEEVRSVPGSGMDSIGEFKNPELLGHGTNWQDEIYQRGSIISHQLAFSGGSEKTTYYFSGGYFDQKGTLIETGFKRYTLRANIDQQVKSWLKAGFTANLSRSNQKIGLSDGFDAVTSTVLYNSPAAPVRDINGNFITTTIIGGSTFGNPSNPVAMASARDVRNIGSRGFGSLYAELNIFRGLTFRTEGNYDFSLNSAKAFQPYIQNPDTKAVIISPSKLREERNNSLYTALKNYFNYYRDFGLHSIGATLGHEVQKSTYDYINANRNDLTLNLPSLNAGKKGNDSGEEIGAGAGNWSMESYFARVNYTFNQKYGLSATVRRDGSSSFGPGKRWGTFPAASVSWTVTNEPFFKDNRYLNYLKLRLGAGSVGNQNVGGENLFVSNVTLTTGPFGIGGMPANVANPYLAWESVRTYNAGLDLTTLNKKLELTVDVYKKISTDMILSTQLGYYSGLGSDPNKDWNYIKTPRTNDGKMTNTGIDIGITSYNIQSKDFNWRTSVVFSHYKNILNRLNTPDATIKGEFDEYGTKSLVTLSQQGQPVGSFYGFVTDGLFRTEAELNDGIDYGLAVEPGKLWLGDIRFKDLNGDKKVDDKDVTVIGNPNPKFTYGITNTLNWKNIDFSIFLQGSYGADIFNYSKRRTEGMSSQYNNQLTTVLDRYTPGNPDGSLPRYNQWHNNNIRISDRFIEDGSYLRIQNIAIGYSVPKSLLNKIKVSSLRVYASVQNVYTFTNYSGYDPELGAYNNLVTFMNIDNGHYPNPRSFTIGTNIEF